MAANGPTNQDVLDQLVVLQGQFTTLQQENTTLSNKIQALQQAAAAAGAGGGSGGQVVQAGGGQQQQRATTFALTPATMDLTGLINFASKLGQSIYKQGCDKLTKDEGFPMTPATTVAFVKAFENRCSIMGWNHGAQIITKFLNRDNLTIDVVRHYVQIAKADLKSGCKEFCKAGGMHCFQGRATQNNHMMALCLKKSLTVAALARLKPYQSQYLFNSVEYGPLMYKIIMRLTTIDSIATNEALRANINSLLQYAASVNGDVDLINSYFDVNMSQLLARGQTVDDPIAKLFDAYLATPNHTFRQYISKKQDDYHDGNLGHEFRYKSLMAQATVKFTYLTTRKICGAKSPDEECLIAMILDLKGKLKLALALNAKRKKEGTKEVKGALKTKNKKNTSNKTYQKKEEAWKRLPPKDGEPATKDVGEMKYQWCVHHMAWGVHSAQECCLGASRKDAAKQGKENKPKDRALSYAATAVTIAGGPGFTAFISELSDDEE
jgi:hypothetical protein